MSIRFQSYVSRFSLLPHRLSSAAWVRGAAAAMRFSGDTFTSNRILIFSCFPPFPPYLGGPEPLEKEITEI